MKPNELINNQHIFDKNALVKLNQIGLPTKKTESYRHFDITPLLSDDYNFDLKNTFQKHEKDKDFITIILKNGLVDLEKSDFSTTIELKNSVKQQRITDNALYYLSETFLENEQTIFIKEHLDKPVKIINQFSGTKGFIPNSLNIIVENDLHVNIIEIFDDQSLEKSFINANRTFSISSGAQLNYIKLQDLKHTNSLIINYIPNIAANALFNIVAIDLGANVSLNITDTTLHNKKSEYSFHGIIKTHGEQKSGNIASMHHIKEDTTSNFICKHILKDEASALFQVSSTVEQEAKFSKTFQNSQTILLENGPKINAIPQLILHTDELEAAHGATSGSLDQEALYYLMSRGIDENVASNMLIKAIELQVINTITNIQIQEFALEFLKR